MFLGKSSGSQWVKIPPTPPTLYHEFLALIYMKFSFTEVLFCFFCFSLICGLQNTFTAFLLYSSYGSSESTSILCRYGTLYFIMHFWHYGVSIFFFHVLQIRWLQILCWLSFRTLILWCAMKTLGIDLTELKPSSTTEIFTSFSWFCIWIQ